MENDAAILEYPENDVNEINTKPDRKPKYILTVPLIAYCYSLEMSNSDIARQYGMTPSAVSQYVKRNAQALLHLKDYKRLQSFQFKHLAYRFTNSITDKDIKKTPPAQRVTAAAIAVDKSQILEGEPSHITLSKHEVSMIDKVLDDIEVVKNEDNMIDITPDNEHNLPPDVHDVQTKELSNDDS
jgi:predicted transcriptional regulator